MFNYFISLFRQDPFNTHVDNVLAQNGYSKNDDQQIIEKIFRETNFRQKFVFIIVKKNQKFCVLLILDELHRNKIVVKVQRNTPDSYIIINKCFNSEQQARNYVNAKIVAYRKGQFDGEAQYYRIVTCQNDCPHEKNRNYDRCFLPGDYITRKLQGFWLASHAGIYCGRGKIVHYDSTDQAATIWNCISGNGTHHVHLAAIENFVTFESQKINILVHCFQQSLKEEKVREAVELAGSKYGNGEYGFLTNNCQHFASLISTGRLEMIDREIVEQGLSTVAIFAGAAAVGYVAYRLFFAATENDDAETGNVVDRENEEE